MFFWIIVYCFLLFILYLFVVNFDNLFFDILFNSFVWKIKVVIEYGLDDFKRLQEEDKKRTREEKKIYNQVSPFFNSFSVSFQRIQITHNYFIFILVSNFYASVAQNRSFSIFKFSLSRTETSKKT